MLAMIWGVFAMSIGLWVAALMVWPDATFGQAWSSYGRLRPVHTTGVIFAFGGNALIATSFHVMQRTWHAWVADQLSPWFVLVGYNLFLVWAVSSYFTGIMRHDQYDDLDGAAARILITPDHPLPQPELLRKGEVKPDIG